MAALPGIVGVVVFLYLRPHEMFASLGAYNALYPAFGLAALGMLHDLAERRARAIGTPALPYAAAFAIWSLLTLAVRAPDRVGSAAANVTVCLALYLVIGQGVQRLSTLRKVTALVLALGLFAAGVGLAQGLSPTECVITDPSRQDAKAIPTGLGCDLVEPDGSPHDGLADCLLVGSGRLPYRCEHVGPFGTSSVAGRVRYLGVLLDPNDLALATAIALPFAFAAVAIRRSILRVGLLLASLAVVGGEIVLTQSRGGQATLGAVLAAYFVERWGIKRGAIVGACAIIPVMVLGGRSDGAADDSTMERLGCAAAGIKMLLTYPFTGVGYLRFNEYHNLTAHNAYVLVAGELGAPGMWLFVVVLHLSIKIPLTVLRAELGAAPDGAALRAIALALLAALAGAAVGIFFLSWAYHYVLWLYFGLAAALHSVAARTVPGYTCALTRREGLRIAAGCVIGLALWSLYIMRRGAWS